MTKNEACLLDLEDFVLSDIIFKLIKHISPSILVTVMI